MEKIRKTKNISWIICSISFLLIFVSGAIMQTSWYPDRTLQGWPIVISILVCLCSLIIAINQTIKYSKAKKITSSTPQKNPPQAQLKNNPANSIVSLVCAIIPLAIYLITFLFSIGQSNTYQSGWYLTIYYWTIGIPLFFVWLICGILGLKSEKRKLAIISLIIKPIGTAVFALLLLIFSH